MDVLYLVPRKMRIVNGYSISKLNYINPNVTMNNWILESFLDKKKVDKY